ncbi:hypothetical protein LUZ60_016967 [Juncus effusus]|nr:hypothetical protein LUZ60_016967 [Juncus effusus]
MENGGEAGAGAEGGVVDATVGTIVWVRRRNGSWWPGRILGPDELAESHLLSPRSGTPVKLLGREDASVDWYNLEKSKRVKAFRCGEFDACIERAEAAQGVPIKKREKYARREDAILHALELERKQQNTNEDRTGTVGIGSGTVGTRSCSNRLNAESKKTEVSHRYKSKKPVIPSGSWDSLPLSVPVPDQCQLAPELHPYQPGVSHAFDTGAVLLHEPVPVPVRGNLMGGSPVYLVKRNQCGFEDFSSRQLALPAGTEVKLENLSMDFLKEPVPLQEEDFEPFGSLVSKNECKDGSGLEIGPRFGLEIGPKSESETETESESGSSEETDTDMETRPGILRDTRQTVNQDQASQYPSTFQHSENYRELCTGTGTVPYTDSNAGTSFVPNYDSQEETGVSTWNSKGKRNNRNNTNKKSNQAFDFYRPKEETDEMLTQHYDEPFEYNYENAPPMLIDVDLKVQKTTYQGERVPLVSLMSRLNGKAIVGHPLQIEILEEGSTAGFLPCTSSGTGTDSCTDGTGLSPTWRTGRRTVKQRVPRPNLQIWKKKKKKKVVGKSSKKSTKSKSKMKAVSSFSGGGDMGLGFVKSDGAVPLVTCVPVKVVYSRISEAVGKPSCNRVRTVRDPN